MTLTGFYRWGEQNARAAHVSGDAIPEAVELVESLTLCGAIADLETEPTPAELAAYVQGWLDTAVAMNKAVCDA